MTQAQEPGKRLISKGEYILRLSFHSGLAFSGFCAVGAAIMCGLAAVFCSFGGIFSIGFAVADLKIQEFMGTLLFFALACVFGAGCRFLWRLGLVGIKKCSQDNTVPFTRANTADIPAPDSLVRASEEPVQAQEAVLLRAAVGTQARQEEQLLRAAMDGQGQA